MNISLLVLLMNLIASATMEQANDGPMLSNSGEFLAKNSTLLVNLIRTNIKNELRKLKSSVTDSIMEEFLNYYSKKFETVDTLNTNFDLLSKKVALMAKNLNILAQNYRVISKNHRNLVNIVRNNMIANKELNQVKLNSLKKKSIDASKHNREKLKSDFINDLENKYSVLFDGGILEVLKSIQDSPKTASHSPLVQTTPSPTSPSQLVIENIPTVPPKQIPDPCICKHAIRVKINKKNGETINRTTILKSLISLDADLTESIDTVTTIGKNICIICIIIFVSFKESFDYKVLIGKCLPINEHSVSIENAEEPLKNEKIFTFKFYGLKPNFDKYLIEKHLISEGVLPMEIVNIYDEFMSDAEFRHIKTGTVRAKLKFNAVQNTKYYEIVKKIPKNAYIQGHPVSIERVGEPRCRFCQSTEHKVMHCKLKDLKCVKCNGRGHTAPECNLARRIAKSNDDHLFDDGEGVEIPVVDEIEPQINKNKSQSNNLNNKNDQNTQMMTNVDTNGDAVNYQSPQLGNNSPSKENSSPNGMPLPNFQTPFGHTPLGQLPATNTPNKAPDLFNFPAINFPIRPSPTRLLSAPMTSRLTKPAKSNRTRKLGQKSTPESVTGKKARTSRKYNKNTKNKENEDSMDFTDKEIESEASKLLNLSSSKPNS